MFFDAVCTILVRGYIFGDKCTLIAHHVYAAHRTGAAQCPGMIASFTHQDQSRSPYSLSLSAHPLPPPSSQWSNRLGCNKCASAENPTRRQAMTDKFVSVTWELDDTARAGVPSTTTAMRDRVRLPQIDAQNLTYHFHNPSSSSERAHTSTRSRDVHFSELEPRRENGVISLALFLAGHGSGSKS